MRDYKSAAEATSLLSSVALLAIERCHFFFTALVLHKSKNLKGSIAKKVYKNAARPSRLIGRRPDKI